MLILKQILEIRNKNSGTVAFQPLKIDDAMHKKGIRKSNH